MMTNMYLLDDVELELTLPDGSSRQFTLPAPTAENPYWFRVVQEDASAIYKDPLRRRQRGTTFYYPEFHFSYGHHHLFTTTLLVATNIVLRTAWAEWRVNCLLVNEEAVKNYLNGMAASSSEGHVVPSGELELVFKGRHRESWQQVLAYFFYFVPGFNWLTWDSTEYTFDSTQEVFV